MFAHPFWPKTAIRPSIATSTGSMNGAPISLITKPRPKNLLRDKARATGIAREQDIKAEKRACKIVNRKADQSAGPKPAKVSA